MSRDPLIPSSAMFSGPTPATGLVRISEYLIQRLQDLGVGHVFGVPGDFVLKLFEEFEHSPLQVINTCDEQGAGFAADAYARINGLGVVCVTYGVGGLKVANTTGQAYAEESPVVVISGAPGVQEQADGALLHHMIKGYDTQRLVYDQLTVASTVLDDPETACREIDRVLNAALVHKRPVYIELPRDMTLVEVPRPQSRPAGRAPSDGPTLRAAVDDAVSMLNAARQPVVFLGVQAVRFGKLPAALQIIERSSLPTTVTPLDKSALSEQHPCFIGLYAGKMSRQNVIDYVESADCLLLLGPLLTDVNLGGNTADIAPERCIHATRDGVKIGYRTYDHVRIEDFIDALARANLPDFSHIAVQQPADTCATWRAEADTALTVARLFERLGCFLGANTMVLADPGDAMFGALDLPVRQDHDFLANAFYASLGFAVPASIGAQLAAPDRRPLVLVGDGAFQMTGMELSTSIRYGLSPIVIVLNNAGYLTERLMIDGAFNDVLRWDYSKLPEVFGGGRSFLIQTEEDLDAALLAAERDTGQVCLLDVQLDPADASPALRRLAERFGAAAGRV